MKANSIEDLSALFNKYCKFSRINQIAGFACYSKDADLHDLFNAMSALVKISPRDDLNPLYWYSVSLKRSLSFETFELSVFKDVATLETHTIVRFYNQNGYDYAYWTPESGVIV